MRLVHMSDLHFGRHDPQVAGSLAADISAQAPDLVVASGDFTQLGTESEFRAARAFLETLPKPLFAVPGNHDVPATHLVRRFIAPYRLYRRYIADELEPFVEIDGVAFAALNTSRRWRFEWNWGNGTLGRRQIAALASRFAAATPGAMRVVVAHHPLLYPQKIVQKEARTVEHADLALKTFGEIGVRMVLSGHFHLSYVRKYEAPGSVMEGVPRGPREAAEAPILVVQASSAISTRRRGEPNSYNVIDIADGAISIAVREWVDEGWRARETTLAAAIEPDGP